MSDTGNTTPEGAPPRRPSVLVIDDEPTIRAALRRFFTRLGWSYDEAPDGAAALAKLSTCAADCYSVIITDVRMPGLSGVELHDRLTVLRPELLERLIVLTGDVTSSDAADFVGRTHCPVLEKPFSLPGLAELIDRVRARADRRAA